MLELRGRSYHLCQIDTGVLSEMLKHPDVEFRKYYETFGPGETIPCFSPMTFVELRSAEPLFSAFLDYFSALPCLFLKGYEELLADEVAAYPDPTSLTAGLLSPLSIQVDSGTSRREALQQIFDSRVMVELLETRRREQRSILEGMLSLKGNYPPNRDGRYPAQRVREFAKEASFQQLCMRAHDFVRQELDHSGQINVDSFPSVKMMSYNVFQKFYADPRRRPAPSDVFDVIMSASLPYVDSYLTERHQAEVMRRTQRCDPFIQHLDVRTLKDIR